MGEHRILIGGNGERQILLDASMANRHGLITGATGTGKTVTLQILAESFARLGVPVFTADMKGDLSGVAKPGKQHPKVTERIDYIKIDGELMHTLMTDQAMQDAVSNIVTAAQDREIKTIAERVENANAMAVLFQLGLDYMQGHYVHEPAVVLQDSDSESADKPAELASANST